MSNLLNLKKDNDILHISGRIDTNTAPILREELNKYEDGTSAVLDLSDLEYISSSGLRELLIAAKRLGSDNLHMTGVRPEIAEIIKMTGFSEMLSYSNASFNKDIRDMSFAEMLKYRVDTAGDKVALRYNGKDYTWDHIDRWSTVLAGRLFNQGAKRMSHIGICGFNSPGWIAAFFAVQKLGGIAVLINPQLTPDEIISLSHIGDITHLCYGQISTMKDEQAFLDQVTNAEVSLITSYLNMEIPITEDESLPMLPDTCASEADDVSVMIFTSGSTGKPKGALLSAYGLLHSAYNEVIEMHFTEADCFCEVLPLFHIFGLIMSFLAACISGSKMVIPKSLKGKDLLTLIHEEGCTVFNSVPTLVLMLMSAPEFSSELVKTLRVGVLGGAPLTKTQFENLITRFPNAHFLPGYGMSEITPISLGKYDDTAEKITETIGKPVNGVTVKIRDIETKRDCKTGERGEIIVQGNQLMCSYYKYSLDMQPFGNDGFLHTGDLGFLDEDGYIHFVGRAKELIIRGGENIVPGEVASAISEHDDIADVKVVGIPDDLYGEIVTAAVIMKEGTVFDEQAMRSFLTGRLAKYKIPAHFVIYTRFPALSNGKIDVITLTKEIIEKCNGAGH